MDNLKGWIDVGDAAKLVGITKASIHYHIPRGHFRVVRRGSGKGMYLIEKASLLKHFGIEEVGDETVTSDGESNGETNA